MSRAIHTPSEEERIAARERERALALEAQGIPAVYYFDGSDYVQLHHEPQRSRRVPQTAERFVWKDVVTHGPNAELNLCDGESELVWKRVRVA